MKNSIIKKLRSDPKFNPFNDKYDDKEIQKAILEISKAELTDEAKKTASTLNSLVFFHSEYITYYKFFNEKIKNTNLSAIDIMKFHTAFTNRDYLLAKDFIHRELSKQHENKFDDFYKIKMPTYRGNFGKIDVSSVAEIGIDVLNITLNYLKFFINNIKSVKTYEKGTEIVDEIGKFYRAANLYYILKFGYEDAIWSNGYIDFDSKEKIIKIYHGDCNELVLNEIGFFRLQQNISVAWLTIKEKLEANSYYKDVHKNYFLPHKNAKRIKSVYVQDGYLKYKLAKGFDKDEFDIETQLYSSLSTFYPFMANVPLPNFTNLNLHKIFSLFSSFRTLVSIASDYTVSTPKNRTV